MKRMFVVVVVLLGSRYVQAQECTRVVVSVGACSDGETEPQEAPVPVMEPQRELVPVAPQRAIPQYLAAPELPRVGERELKPARYSELQQLYLRRPSLGGPITLLAIGGATAAIAALVATEETTECFSCLEEVDGSTPGFVYGALALGAAVVVAGIAWLVRRVRQRQIINLRIRELTSGPRW